MSGYISLDRHGVVLRKYGFSGTGAKTIVIGRQELLGLPYYGDRS